MAATEAFVRDAVEAVIRQVDDHKGAERMFLEEFGYRRPRRKSPGRPPDKEKNAAMLAEWKRQKDLGLSTHHATCAAADELEFAQKGKKKSKASRLKGDFDDSARSSPSSPRPPEAPRLLGSPTRNISRNCRPCGSRRSEASPKRTYRKAGIYVLGKRGTIGIIADTLEPKGVRKWNQFSPT
jgi:hypothetical protein